MLLNVTNTNGMLLARANDSTATAETITQGVGETDFESIRETRSIWRLANISDTVNSIANKLVSLVPINTGDRLFLVKNNGTIVDFKAGAVTKSAGSMVPNMTSLTTPAGTLSFGGQSMDAAKTLNAFDGNVTTHTDWISGTAYFVYKFENNIPKIVKNIYLKNQNQQNNWFMVKISGSLDGINWATISLNTGIHESTIAAGRILKIQSPGMYSHYKIQFFRDGNYTDTGNVLYQLHTISFLTETGDSIDTSSIAPGEIPSKVFKFQDTIAFNGVNAVEKDIYYEYGTAGTKLFVFPIYNDVLLTGRTLTTKVSFSAVGNELSEITGQIYKKLV